MKLKCSKAPFCIKKEVNEASKELEAVFKIHEEAVDVTITLLRKRLVPTLPVI